MGRLVPARQYPPLMAPEGVVDRGVHAKSYPSLRFFFNAAINRDYSVGCSSPRRCEIDFDTTMAPEIVLK